MLFVVFFIVAVFAMPFTTEVLLRGSDNVLARATKEVDDVLASVREHVDDQVFGLRVLNGVLGFVLVVLHLVLRLVASLVR